MEGVHISSAYGSYAHGNLSAWLYQLKLYKLEMWANANVLAALPNIGGALCSMPQFG